MTPAPMSVSNPEPERYAPGTVLDIRHARKGRFTGRVVADTGEWIEVIIETGRPRCLNVENDMNDAADALRFRRSLALCLVVSKPPEAEGILESGAGRAPGGA